MPTLIEKRQSLHRSLKQQQEDNSQLQQQLLELQPLAAMGQITYMIAHEMNNLLSGVSTYTALAMKHPDDKALTAKALEKSNRNATIACKMMESMIALANGEDQQTQPTNLKQLVDETFVCLCRDFAKDAIEVIQEIDDDLTINVVAVQMHQVLMNLILNAREAMLQQGGILTVRAKQTGDTVTIEVSDTGSGITDENMEQIFKPFFTTKSDGNYALKGQSCGLGLAFCKTVIDRHGGRIDVESIPDRSTTFIITLPQATG